MVFMGEAKLPDAAKKLGPYKVHIATMCSGIEAPLIACLEFRKDQFHNPPQL